MSKKLKSFTGSNAPTCSLSFDERWAEHLRLTAENAPPLNPQGKPDWMHPDFDRCSNDWWRLELCQHCHADGGCKAHFAKRYPTLFPGTQKWMRPPTRKLNQRNQMTDTNKTDNAADGGLRTTAMFGFFKRWEAVRDENWNSGDYTKQSLGSRTDTMLKELREVMAGITAAIGEIVVPTGEDSGVVLLSNDAPTHPVDIDANHWTDPRKTRRAELRRGGVVCGVLFSVFFGVSRRSIEGHSTAIPLGERLSLSVAANEKQMTP